MGFRATSGCSWSGASELLRRASVAPLTRDPDRDELQKQNSERQHMSLFSSFRWLFHRTENHTAHCYRFDVPLMQQLLSCGNGAASLSRQTGFGTVVLCLTKV